MEALSDAQEKIRSTLDLIDELEGIDFPHPGALEALRMLQGGLNSRLNELNSLDQDASPKILRGYCIQTTTDIVEALELLGFVVNSTSIRNAFEVHQCLLDIAKKLTNEESHLLLSFEWNYVPFTYPLNVPSLPNFVVIGLPASEANNALIIPAAGHELGHSAWRINDLTSEFEVKLQSIIKELIERKYWQVFSRFNAQIIKKPEDLDGLLGKELWKRAHVWALNQSEELFCDIVGLFIFGASYLHTFSYLLAPKFGEYRTEEYPAIKTRSQFLQKAAENLEIPAPPDFVDRFDAQPSRYAKNQYSFLMSELADAAVEIFFDEIFQTAVDLCRNKGFELPKTADWEETVQAFKSHVPAENSKSLADIINAGWEVCRDATTMSTFDAKKPRNRAALNELLLKSIEVFEIENLLKGVKS